MATETKSRFEGRDLPLLVGDLVCFLIFAVLGLRSHEEGITGSGILRAAVPFQLGWLVVNFALRSQGREPRADSRGVVRAWAPSWVIGLIVRTAAFDRSFAPTFAVVSLLFNGVLLLIWRCLVAPLLLRRTDNR